MGEVPASFRRLLAGVAIRVITELAISRAPRTVPSPGQTAKDLDVRVRVKSPGQLLLEPFELTVHLGQHGGGRGDDGPVRLRRQRRSGEVFRVQGVLDGLDQSVDVALSAAPTQQGGERRLRQGQTELGSRSSPEHGQRVGEPRSSPKAPIAVGSRSVARRRLIWRRRDQISRWWARAST